jgi:hypothetical protein
VQRNKIPSATLAPSPANLFLIAFQARSTFGKELPEIVGNRRWHAHCAKRPTTINIKKELGT